VSDDTSAGSATSGHGSAVAPSSRSSGSSMTVTSGS
jgi:hypothetical protein